MDEGGVNNEMEIISESYTDWRSIPEETLAGVVDVYQAVFREPPWQEDWAAEEVRGKLAAEVDGTNSFLTVLRPSEGSGVVGFCWGRVIGREEIVARVLRAHRVDDEAALQEIATRVEDRVVFVDEIAKLPGFRGGGFQSIFQLVWPVATCAASERIGVLCWSGRGSKIIPILTQRWPFEAIGTAGDITFFYVPIHRGYDGLRQEFGLEVR